jgi:hypothetical protein
VVLPIRLAYATQMLVFARARPISSTGHGYNCHATIRMTTIKGQNSSMPDSKRPMVAALPRDCTPWRDGRINGVRHEGRPAAGKPARRPAFFR